MSTKNYRGTWCHCGPTLSNNNNNKDNNELDDLKTHGSELDTSLFCTNSSNGQQTLLATCFSKMHCCLSARHLQE